MSMNLLIYALIVNKSAKDLAACIHCIYGIKEVLNKYTNFGHNVTSLHDFLFIIQALTALMDRTPTL
jgi:hypothetical protein